MFQITTRDLALGHVDSDCNPPKVLGIRMVDNAVRNLVGSLKIGNLILESGTGLVTSSTPRTDDPTDTHNHRSAWKRRHDSALLGLDFLVQLREVPANDLGFLRDLIDRDRLASLLNGAPRLNPLWNLTGDVIEVMISVLGLG